MRIHPLHILLGFFFISAPLFAADGYVEVRPTGRELFESAPREIVTVTFRVTSSAPERHEFISSVGLPEQWKLITTDFPFEIDPGASDIRVVSFFIPQTTLAGTYEVTFSVQDRQYPSVSDSYTCTVVVLPVLKLRVMVLESPELVIAGEEYSSSFIISNDGNMESTINLSVASGENLPVAIDADTLRLAPGGMQTITVHVQTDGRMQEQLRHRLELTAAFAGNEDTKASAISFTDIVPRTPKTGERFHTIPVRVSLRQAGEKNGDFTSGFQADISGSGTLDEEGEQHIQFHFRNPDNLSKSIYGERDENVISYWTDRYEFHLGDRTYSLSPLTDSYQYGRGIESRLHGDRVSFGAYYMKARWMLPESEEIASYADYRVNPNYTVGINLLKKKVTGDDVELVSAESRLRIAENTDVELEYASGINAGGDAYHLNVSGFQKRISYQFRLIHADSGYRGYYRDMSLLAAGFGVPLVENLRLKANYNRQKSNLDLNPAIDYAPLTTLHQLGLEYRFKTGASLNFLWQVDSREDRFPTPRFDYSNNSARVDISQSFRQLSLYANAQFGKADNKLSDDSFRSERYSASIYYRPSGTQSYRGYVQLDNTGGYYSGEKDRNTTSGLSGTFHIVERTFLNIDFQTNRRESYADRNIFELRMNHTFLNDTVFSVRGRRTSYSDTNDRNETAFLVEYTLPLGLPVSRKKNIGSIGGMVFDEESRQGIPDAILRLNGDTAVTDRNGNFSFTSLVPGTYYLNIDTARMGLDRITAEKLPIKVIVEDGKETRVEMGITRAASLSGEVNLYRAENGNGGHSTGGANGTVESDAYHVLGGNGNGSSVVNNGNGTLVKTGGLANLLVEMTDGVETKRVLTESNGHFEFHELRPGDWNLKVYDNNIPEYHLIEEGTRSFVLEAGDTETVEVRVLPQRRSIIILEEGGTLE